MNKRAVLITFILLFYVPFCFAIKWDSCWKEVKTWEFLGISSSTTSFVSSIGDCAMLANTDQEKQKIFFATNYEDIKKDIARGDGEHLRTLVSLFLIKNKKVDSFIEELKKNYMKIYKSEGNEIEYSYSEILLIAKNGTRLK
ncbi:MAG: hypothetical protein BroJett040_19500 [Oligoflexia bacterium]|nr:MAG: hypothetical protein BroJett040_19500 [Oligoflexia bacterium]